MSENLGEQSVKLSVNCGKVVAAFVRRRAVPLIASVVLVLLAWQGWSLYDRLRTRQVTFLWGGVSADSLENARSIKAQMETAGPLLGVTNYAVHIEPTDGYEANRRRISGDDDGRTIGFAYDGFGDSENVAVVLPLDQRYLHILCRKDFAEALPAWKSSRTLNFRDIVVRLKPGRVYLGTAGSATRQCAEIVLRHFKLDPGEYSCYGIGGFDEIRAALKAGHIDLAFSSGPFNSPLIRPLAKDGTCVLVGLNTDRDALVQQHPQLLPVQFKANSYVSGDFCTHELETIGARRLLICSQKMREKDVYVFGIRTAEALRDKMPELARTATPSGEDWQKRWETRYPLHAGAKLIFDRREPSTSPQWLSVVLATAFLWGLAELLRWLNSFFVKKPEQTDAGAGAPAVSSTPDAQPTCAAESATPEETYAALKCELDKHIVDLECAPVPLPKSSYEEWGGKIDKLRERILEANLAGKLKRERAHALLEGLRREMVYEYEVRRPVRRKRTSKQ